MAKRTPWLNARKQPPVNGGNWAEYEIRCTSPVIGFAPQRWGKYGILRNRCPHCEWRGLAQPSDGGGG
jgi:hypothetical protein